MNKLDPILVKDIMTKKVVSATPETPLLEASQTMLSNNFTGLPVIDKENKVVGIITEYDLLSKGTAIHLPTFIKLFGAYPNRKKGEYLIDESLGEILAFAVKDVMNPDPLMMHEDDSLAHIVDKFSKHHRVNPIPIVDTEGRIVGVVSRFDVIKYYATVLAIANRTR